MKKEYRNFCTIKDLKNFIEKYKIPDDAKIFLQRVEDVYFEKHNWETENKEGYHYYSCLSHNEKVDSGEFANKEEYPLLEEIPNKFSEKDLELAKEKYYACWSPVKYPEDNNLYLDSHY